MLAALGKAFSQSGDARFLRIVLFGIGGAILAYIVLFFLISWGLSAVVLFESTWLDWLTKIFGGLTAAILSVFLFPSVVTLVIGFFLDDIIDTVESKFYPDAPPRRRQSWAEVIALTFRMTGLAVVLNLLFLPVYLIPVLNVVVFFFLNSYLLGWEYYSMVAVHHQEPHDVKTGYQINRKEAWKAGAIIVILLTLPVVCVVMPIIAAAFMTHVFHSLPSAASKSP